jgi:hypothetical protein
MSSAISGMTCPVRIIPIVFNLLQVAMAFVSKVARASYKLIFCLLHFLPHGFVSLYRDLSQSRSLTRLLMVRIFRQLHQTGFVWKHFADLINS